MRILQVVADGANGGGTTAVLGLMESLAQQGHELQFITQENSYAMERAKELRLPVYGVDFFKRRLNLAVPRALQELLAQIRPEIVHAHGGRAAFNLSLLRQKTCPLVYTVHGYHFLGKRFWVRPFAAFAERWISRRADAVIFVAEHDRKTASDWRLLSDYDKGRVIYNGLRMPSIAGNSQDRHAVFIGRLDFPKDPVLFVEIAGHLAVEGWKFSLVGGGELEHPVREQIARLKLESAVQCHGVLPRHEALDVLARAELLVMTSRWEGLPFVALEAMALNVPVVGAAVRGISEVIRDGETGVLVKDRDPAAFAQAMRALHEVPNERQRLAVQARAYVDSNFSPETCCKRHEAIYEFLLKRA